MGERKEMSLLQDLRLEHRRASPFPYMGKARLLLACRHKSAGGLTRPASTQGLVVPLSIYLIYEYT